MTVDRQR